MSERPPWSFSEESALHRLKVGGGVFGWAGAVVVQNQRSTDLKSVVATHSVRDSRSVAGEVNRSVPNRFLCAALVASLLLMCSSAADAQDSKPHPSAASRRVVGAVFADQHVPDSGLNVHRRASAMPAADRYSYLVEWVLPNAGHEAFRVVPDFTPTDPSPPAAEKDAGDEQRTQRQGQRRIPSGGQLVSPALDLIAVARELGKLSELRDRITLVEPRNNQQQREQLALLALVAMAAGDTDTALRHLDTFFPMIEANSDHTLAGRSPELLAIYGAFAHSATRGFARDAAANLYVHGVRTDGRRTPTVWESHLAGMLAAARRGEPGGQNHRQVSAAAETSVAESLAEWSPSSHTTALSRGSGFAHAGWQRTGDSIHNANSHKDDFLYYFVPLQGNYQVECDVLSKDSQNTQIVVGGHWAEPLFYNRKHYEYGDIRARIARGNLEPPLTRYYDSTHMRVTVNGQIISCYTNGRLVHRVEVQGDVDPWIAVRSEDRFDGAATDIRITGDPIIPREIRLTASENLAGWLAYYPGQVGKPKATWQQLGDIPNGGGIIAPRRTDLAGMNVERLLQYHRPMFEDGTIEYEFFYRKGEIHAHPALDRLAFLLEPQGVRIHWLSDAEFDRTALDSGNVIVEPEARRGPELLPLLNDQWNRLRLTLERDRVSLFLNDQLVYQRELEATNQRTFGLFHYSDRTEARVRNVRWRGNWPLELPPVSKQELSSQKVRELDERRSELSGVIEHDFAKHGMPPEKFTLTTAPGQTISQIAEGIRVDRPGGRGYFGTDLRLNLIMAGDFDVTATFSHFDARPSADAISTAGIRLLTNDANAQQCLLMRRFVRAPKQEDQQVIQGVMCDGLTDATLDWKTIYSLAKESNSGRLRVARRGNRVFYLTAEEDSPNFQLFAETAIATGTSPRQAIQLFALSKEDGRMSVVWKDVSVHAEKLTFIPPSTTIPLTLSVMNHDGTAVREVLPAATMIPGAGSPAWSHHAGLIAFDVYNGSTANSRLYVVQADGSNVRDLGIGNMPTFSPDDKRIAFSWGGRGVAVMNVDGTDRQVLDESGWGAQWSSDGRIAYTRGGNVVIMDPQTKNQREILEGEHASRYTNVYWNLGWSRDGKRVCFKARTRANNQYEIAVVSAAGSRQEFQVLYTSPQEMHADFSWHPDGNRILFAMVAGGGSRLFTVDRNTPGKPELWPGQPPNYYITGADWSDDGKQIAFSGQRLPDWDAAAKPANQR